MATWKSALWRLWPFKSDATSSTMPQCGRKTETKKITRALGPWEAYMVKLQSILIWERPGTSSVALVAVNVLYWLIVWSELRVYFVASLAALAMFLHQQWVHSIWPEIRVPQPEPDDSEEWTPVHPSVLSVPEISQYVEGTLRFVRDNYAWLLQLRRHQPALFCAIVTTGLSMLWVVGHLVPGHVLVYVALMLVMTGPGILLHVLPDSFYDRLNKMRAALRGDTSTMEASNVSLDSDISEFMPELQSMEAQAALDVPLMSQDPPEVEQLVEEVQQERETQRSTRKRKAHATSVKPNTSHEEGMTTFFTSGLPEDFPSIDNESVEDLDGPDLDLAEAPCPVPQPIQERKPIAGADRYQMEFVSSHFGESSDEDEDFTEGLSFEEHSQRRAEARQVLPPSTVPVAPAAGVAMDPLGQLMSAVIAQNAGTMLSALGQNLVTSVIGQASSSEMIQSRSQQLVHTPAAELPPPRMSRSEDSQQYSTTDLEDDFELISDEECQ